MKKITLALAFLTFGVQAQEFPAPYCNISGSGTTTEEITSIVLDETTITNTDFTSILVNQINATANVIPGQTYTLTVKGNTKGNFANNFVAFIDWNHNDVLNDEGEVFAVGTIISSTGFDEKSATLQITIPEDAIVGETRIRLTKTYTDEDSPAIVNPCAIEMDAFGMGNFPGFGQALDFTLMVGTLATANFDANALKIFPVPASDVLNIEYKSTINQIKIYNLLGQEVYTNAINSANAQVDISKLTAGHYILSLTSDMAQQNFKIVKK